jgi:hypothetical protein
VEVALRVNKAVVREEPSMARDHQKEVSLLTSSNALVVAGFVAVEVVVAEFHRMLVDDQVASFPSAAAAAAAGTAVPYHREIPFH